jgi:hypothetical protein
MSTFYYVNFYHVNHVAMQHVGFWLTLATMLHCTIYHVNNGSWCTWCAGVPGVLVAGGAGVLVAGVLVVLVCWCTWCAGVPGVLVCWKQKTPHCAGFLC